MSRLYELLERTGKLEDRRRIISEYLSSNDISSFLPPDSMLTEEMSIPFDDNRISFPFVVGNKYLVEAPYCGHDCPAYVIGVVRTPELAELLIVEPAKQIHDSIGCLPRRRMEPPETMMK